ncbi:MAG: hypothetical protein AM1032_000317 [Mycoplasmataceae bacterium]|nr:MAG: hypothetical protein AM1032_000317 [Mycoplasmataceae bacterium]
MKNLKNLKIKILSENSNEKEINLKFESILLEKSLDKMEEKEKIQKLLDKIEEKMEEIYLDFLKNSEI